MVTDPPLNTMFNVKRLDIGEIKAEVCSTCILGTHRPQNKTCANDLVMVLVSKLNTCRDGVPLDTGDMA